MSFESFAAYEAGRLLKECGAIIRDDHFVYASGRHGSAYVDKKLVLDDREALGELCHLIACSFSDADYAVVVGPESGGIKIADGVAACLRRGYGGRKRAAFSVHAKKTPDGGFAFDAESRSVVYARNVLVVEDVLTTGGSCRKTVELVRAAGGNVVGVGAFVNRGHVDANAVGGALRLVTLVDLPLASWAEEECPLCASGVPVRADLGKGQAFLDRKRLQEK